MEEKMDIENSLDLKYGLMCRPINYYVSLINLKSQGLGGGGSVPLSQTPLPFWSGLQDSHALHSREIKIRFICS